MFYSKSTGGFYDREIHGRNIPADAVKISVEDHKVLMCGQSNGKVITSNSDGFPILVDPPKEGLKNPREFSMAKLKAFLASNPDVVELIK